MAELYFYPFGFSDCWFFSLSYIILMGYMLSSQQKHNINVPFEIFWLCHCILDWLNVYIWMCPLLFWPMLNTILTIKKRKVEHLKWFSWVLFSKLQYLGIIILIVYILVWSAVTERTDRFPFCSCEVKILDPNYTF